MNDSDERRFTEQEVAEILERATSATGNLPAPTQDEGITLAQLQEIGREVGISPERIASAAGALTRSTRPSAPQSTLLGAPRSVARTVHIQRALTDEEWGRLVADLRQTFRAQGHVESHGSLRSWSNGNLKINVEPDEDGYQVRMRTFKGNASSNIAGGVTALVGGVVMAVLLATEQLTGGGLAVVGGFVGGLFALGAGMIAYTRWSLPRWAAERAAQMEGLAERIKGLVGHGE